MEWIKTSERLPEYDDEYIIYGKNMLHTLMFTDGKWYNQSSECYVSNEKVTHWMPFPDPPK